MAYCTNCGQPLTPGQKFCTKCGQAINPLEVTITGKKRKRRSYDNEVLKQGVTLCDDGKYRWIYALNMWKNPTIFFLVYKIFFWIFMGISLMVTLMSWKHIHWDDWDKLWDDTWPALALFAFFNLLLVLSYSIVAAMYGGKYIVLFTMDENGVTHEQIAEQAKKAKKLGALTAAVGAGRGNLSMMGLGIHTAARTSMSSDFSIVRSVKPYKRRNVIKVREILSNNQVYARDEDFDFVYNYIKEHCPRVSCGSHPK